VKITDDKTLLISLREQKEYAFDIVFQRYFKSIYLFISQNCTSAEDAEDLTQEVFIRLWENCHAPIVSIKAYLYSIARNLLIDQTRKNINKLVFDSLNEDTHVGFLAAPESNENESTENLLSILNHIAQSLPERRKKIYHLRWINGLSRKEIAEEMGITVTTVDIQLRKGLEYLRKAVSKIPLGKIF